MKYTEEKQLRISFKLLMWKLDILRIRMGRVRVERGEVKENFPLSNKFQSGHSSDLNSDLTNDFCLKDLTALNQLTKLIFIR